PEETTTDEPVRRCVATWKVRPAREMVRFVRGPGEEIAPDVAGRLPGRGLWCLAERQAGERAVKGRVAQAARATGERPPDPADRVAAQLARRLTDLLGLARRSGQAVAGFDQVEAALAAGRVAVLLQASDGSALGRGKLAAKARARGSVAEIDCLTAA